MMARWISVQFQRSDPLTPGGDRHALEWVIGMRRNRHAIFSAWTVDTLVLFSTG